MPKFRQRVASRQGSISCTMPHSETVMVGKVVNGDRQRAAMLGLDSPFARFFAQPFRSYGPMSAVSPFRPATSWTFAV
jgi:hypothetical protein